MKEIVEQLKQQKTEEIWRQIGELHKKQEAAREKLAKINKEADQASKLIAATKSSPFAGALTTLMERSRQS